MIIGGRTCPYDDCPYDEKLTDDVELVSLDGNPVPDCLSNLNPFPYAIFGSVGAAMAPGMLEQCKYW